MRTASDQLAELITGSHQVVTRLGVFYDGDPVIDDVPIEGGDLTVDGSSRIPGALQVILPRWFVDESGNRIDLRPSASGSPLNAEGTMVTIRYEVSVPGRGREAVDLGWYRVQNWDEIDGGARVSLLATSLEAVLEEARFLSPVRVAKGATYQDAVAKVVGDLLPLSIEATGAVVTGRQVFETDRLGALAALMTSWPARAVVDETGTLVVRPPFSDDDAPVAAYRDGENGTVVARPRSGSRDGVWNAVKASGETTDDATAPVSAVAYVRSGPRRWNGPYGNVPYFYSSPLLTTKAQCRQAAATRLANLQARAEAITVTAVPDPRLEVGDVVDVIVDGEVERIRVDVVTLPLTPGVMTVVGHRLGAIHVEDGD